MNKTHPELSLELLVDNLRAVRLNFQTMPFNSASIYLNSLIEAYEDQLKKAQDKEGKQDD